MNRQLTGVMNRAIHILFPVYILHIDSSKGSVITCQHVTDLQTLENIITKNGYNNLHILLWNLRRTDSWIKSSWVICSHYNTSFLSPSCKSLIMLAWQPSLQHWTKCYYNS